MLCVIVTRIIKLELSELCVTRTSLIAVMSILLLLVIDNVQIGSLTLDLVVERNGYHGT